MNMIISERSREYSWILADDPNDWHFTPFPPLLNNPANPKQWSKREIIREMRYWPALVRGVFMRKGEENLGEILTSYPLLLALWLEYYELETKIFEEILFFTPLVRTKVFADYSLAKLAFVRQLYPKSELTQNVTSDSTGSEYLWLCCEYSDYLAKLRGSCTGKSQLGENTAQYIKSRRGLLTTHTKNKVFNDEQEQEFDNLISIESLKTQGLDWKEHIVGLLIDEAVRLVWENDDEDLRHHCQQFLNAYSHFNRLTTKEEGSKDYICIYRNDAGIQATKKHKKLSGTDKRKRSRGRPPLGYQL